jgi:hypothetical protein
MLKIKDTEYFFELHILVDELTKMFLMVVDFAEKDEGFIVVDKISDLQTSNRICLVKLFFYNTFALNENSGLFCELILMGLWYLRTLIY